MATEPRRDAMPALARWLPAAAVTIVALGGLTAAWQPQLASSHLGRSIWATFHLDSETSLGTWFSVAVLLCGGLAAWQLAHDQRESAPRDARALSLVALACLGLSAEEILGMHERLGNAMARALPMGSWSTFAWVIPGAAVVMMVAACAAGFLRRQALWLRTRLIVSAAMFFGGAVGCEALGGYIYAHHGKESALFQVEVLFEEGLEMAGAILLLDTLLRARQRLAPPGNAPAPASPGVGRAASAFSAPTGNREAVEPAQR